MKKSFLIFLLVIVSPACAQVISGTIVVLNFTKDHLIVAADSVALNRQTGVPNYSYCKIATFDHQLIFTSVGNSGFLSNAGVLLWDNNQLASDSVHAAKRREDGTIDLDDAINLWAANVKSHWNTIDRKLVADLAAGNGGQLTAGSFIGRNLNAKVAVIYPNVADTLDPIKYGFGEGRDTGNCWPCGQLQGGKICGAGAHLDVAATFCSKRKHGDRIDVRTPLKKASESTKLAVKIAEMTIDAYENTAKDVGGNVDAITITKDGSITWNSRKQNCPDNQD